MNPNLALFCRTKELIKDQVTCLALILEFKPNSFCDSCVLSATREDRRSRFLPALSSTGQGVQAGSADRRRPEHDPQGRAVRLRVEESVCSFGIS